VKARAETFAPRPASPRVALAARRYSRFVHRTKLALPALALGLLLLLATWPRVQGVFDSVRLHMPRIDLTDASDLHMVKARYTGIDRENRPFVVTADIARQKPNLDDLITLERPKGDLTMQSGSWLELSGDTGFYQPQPQLLDLFGNVTLYQDKGNEFHSTSAHIDMNKGTAEGDDPVTGQGPFGTIAAQGFRIVDRGDTIYFTGHAQLDMAPRQGQGQAR
jgi:lipopolysaccharide export system protein LptC